MLDTVIKGGQVVDGTGAPAFTADVGIKDGKIVEVGRVSTPAARTIDADGLSVTPGWLDIHTHYDGQATWDPDLDPSFSSGVTTALMGNCGVGFAPVRDGQQNRLIELMEGVEEIPGTALHVGMDWRWNTFPEYLDALDAMPRSFDVGCLMPHGPLRLWAMGEKVGTDKSASGEDMAMMVEQVEAGMKAGAFGLATSRTPVHRTTRGEMTPDYHVDLPELTELSRIVKKYGGFLQVVPEGVTGEDLDGLRHDMAFVSRIVKDTGVDLHVLMFQLANAPDLYLEQFAILDELNRHVRATAQFGGRGTGAILGFLGTNPFSETPTFRRIRNELSIEQWLPELAKPEVRARILSEKNDPGSIAEMFLNALERLYDLGDDLDYEPGPERALATMARASGQTLAETAYDFMLDHSVHPRLYIAFTNYSAGNFDIVADALRRPNVALSASDAGAHVLTVCDGAIHSFMLSHWARDRKRGPKVPLEEVVHWMTQKSAQSIGLTDRGVIAPGKKADINIFGLDAIKVHQPDYRADLPSGSRRILTDVTGYRGTMVSGVLTREHDRATGERPGRLVRYGHC